MVTVAQIREALAELDFVNPSNDDTEVLVELPGSLRPVAGVSIRSTAEAGTQLVVLADL